MKRLTPSNILCVLVLLILFVGGASMLIGEFSPGSDSSPSQTPAAELTYGEAMENVRNRLDNSKDYLINPLNLIINMEIGNIDDLKELREMLELSLVRLAAERATEEDILALEKADWLHREPGLSRKERRDRDIAFHRAIADATGNSVAGELLSALRTVIANRWEDSLPLTAARVSDSERNYHEEIIASLRRHDPDAAYGCLEAYFNEIHRLDALEVAAE